MSNIPTLFDMEPVAVSVIIPVYNVEAYLAECLDSVLAQTLRNIEVICVDDESPDHSIDILNRYAAQDSRVKVLRQKNKRQGGARNTGLRVAQGEYVAYIDSDDWLDANYFERLYSVAVEHDADIASANVTKMRSTVSRQQVAVDRVEVVDELNAKFRISNCPPVFNTTNKIYRRAMLERIGLRFREHIQFEDVEYLTHVLAESGRLVTVPDVYYYYRVHANSTTKSAQTQRKQREKYKAHRRFILYAEKHGIAVDDHFCDVLYRSYSLGSIVWLSMKYNGRRRLWRLLNIIPIWRSAH